MRRRKLSQNQALPGFVSFDLPVFLLWLIMYILLGLYLGNRFEARATGLVLGLVLGIFPSVAMAQRSHYGSMYPWLALPVLILLPLLPEHYRLWLAISAGLVPLAALALTLFTRSPTNFPVHGRIP